MGNSLAYIINVEFIANQGHEGGALYAYRNRLFVDQSNFISNKAHFGGGGIKGFMPDKIYVTNSLFDKNDAIWGSAFNGRGLILSRNKVGFFNTKISNSRNWMNRYSKNPVGSSLHLNNVMFDAQNLYVEDTGVISNCLIYKNEILNVEAETLYITGLFDLGGNVGSDDSCGFKQ